MPRMKGSEKAVRLVVLHGLRVLKEDTERLATVTTAAGFRDKSQLIADKAYVLYLLETAQFQKAWNRVEQHGKQFALSFLPKAFWSLFEE